MGAFLVFVRPQIRRPTQGIQPLRAGCLERQSMTDRTLDISAALREAHLQRLEASLATKTATKPSGASKPTGKLASSQDMQPAHHD